MASLLNDDMSLMSVLDELTYTEVRLAAKEITRDRATEFQDLIKEWHKVFAEEVRLRTRMVSTQATVAEVDSLLDIQLTKFHQTLLIEVGNNKKSPLYKRYFDGTNVTKIGRYVLGKQVEIMMPWVPSLLSSEHEALRAIGREFERLLKAAEIAVAEHRAAEQENEDFRTIGWRHDFIERCNIARKNLEAWLIELSLRVVGLSNNFKFHFFRPTRRKAPDIDTQIKKAEAVVQKLREKKKLAESKKSTETKHDAA